MIALQLLLKILVAASIIALVIRQSQFWINYTPADYAPVSSSVSVDFDPPPPPPPPPPKEEGSNIHTSPPPHHSLHQPNHHQGVDSLSSSTHNERVVVNHTNPNGAWTVCDEGAMVSREERRVNSMNGKINLWTLRFAIRECMVDVPSQFSIWLRSDPSSNNAFASGESNKPNIRKNMEKQEPSVSFDTAFVNQFQNNNNQIQLAKMVRINEIGLDGCRYYNASIDLYDAALYNVHVTRDYAGDGAIFTQQQADVFKTFPIWHNTDPYDFNKSYSTRWEEFGNKTLGITEWLRPLKDRSVATFNIKIGLREARRGLVKWDAWKGLPYCHEREKGVTAVGKGGRWIGPAWAASNCILANLPLSVTSNLMRGIRVRILGDSNFLKLANEASKYICGQSVTQSVFWVNKNQCPPSSENQPPAPFAIVYKFFRAVTEPWNDYFTEQIFDEKKHDMMCDYSIRNDQKLFDIDRYNVTIILPGLWQINQKGSGYPQRFASHLRNVLRKCRASSRWRESGHIMLLNEITSVDPRFHNWYGSWRRFRNIDLEKVNFEQAAILGSQADGVIPVFDMSLMAVHGEYLTPDPVHYWPQFYQAWMQLQIVNILHVLKNKNNYHRASSSKSTKDFGPHKFSSKDYWFLNMTDM